MIKNNKLTVYQATRLPGYDEDKIKKWKVSVHYYVDGLYTNLKELKNIFLHV